MDDRSYLPQKPPLTEQEKAALREAIRKEEEAAVLEAQRRVEIEARLAREEEVRRRARPFGERMFESRCQACHGTTALADIRMHGLDWYLTIWRMRLVNGAVLSHDEQRAIVGHLATRQGAVLWTSTSGLAIGAGIGLLSLLAFLYRGRKSSHHQR